MKLRINCLKKLGAAIKKHSPEILMVAGAAGAVTSTILACRATLKVTDILEEAKTSIDAVHEVQNNPEISEERYSKKDAKKDLTIIYAQTAIKTIKLYAPSVILGTLSITAMFTSNNILRKRNVALAAAYATVDTAFKEYRKRVVNKYGEEIDKALLNGTESKKIEEEITDEETGKVKKVKKTVEVSHIEGCSPYAIYYDKFTSLSCERNEDYNDMVLRGAQNYMNDILRVKGFITLLEVLEYLNLDKVAEPKEYDRMKKAAMVVGWKYEKENPVGDNRVLFTITKTNRELEDGSISPTRIIDFNVDGNIYDRF